MSHASSSDGLCAGDVARADGGPAERRTTGRSPVSAGRGDAQTGRARCSARVLRQRHDSRLTRSPRPAAPVHHHLCQGTMRSPPPRAGPPSALRARHGLTDMSLRTAPTPHSPVLTDTPAQQPHRALTCPQGHTSPTPTAPSAGKAAGQATRPRRRFSARTQRARRAGVRPALRVAGSNVLQRKPRCPGAGGRGDRVKREGHRRRSTQVKQRARPVRASPRPPDTGLRPVTRASQPDARRPARHRPN